MSSDPSKPSTSTSPIVDTDDRGETTIIAAVHAEEAARAAAFGKAIAILCAVGFVMMFFRDDRDNRYRVLIAITALVQGLFSAWVWRRSRNPAHYSRALFRLFGIISASGALVFTLAVGIFSPLPVVLMLGFAFFGASADKWVVYPIAFFVIIVYTTVALLISFGVVQDPGAFFPTGVSVHARVSIVVVVTLAMLVALMLAHASRRSMLEALRRTNEAVRVAQTREAQLAEVKENLDLAARAREGRLTGTRIGRYRLDEIVGRGAMGEVYAAYDEEHSRHAAVKVLRLDPNSSEDVGLTARFLREAEIALKARGPNLVEVLEAGTANDGSVFIAMELLRGRDLAAMLRDQPTMPVPEALRLIDDVARGLAVLHAAGVIHRDLKPQNLFLAEKGGPAGGGGGGHAHVWKILDYGVSKLVGAATMTEAMLVGTPGYMSPEQAEGGVIDARSDVFALGVIAYRVLTGRRPFTGADTPQILYQIVHGDPMRPRELVPTLASELEVALGIALAKRTDDRFATPLDFASALQAAAKGARPRARRGSRVWRREPGTLTLPRISPPAPRLPSSPSGGVEEPTTTLAKTTDDL